MELVQQLSKKIKTEAYVWMGVAGLQVLIGLINVFSGFSEDGLSNLISGIFTLAVAAANFITSRKDLKYSSEILEKPVGIVENFKPIKGLIITLVYNVVVGGVVGIVGCIFGFITRSFVLNNEQTFLALEAEAKATV